MHECQNCNIKYVAIVANPPAYQGARISEKGSYLLYGRSCTKRGKSFQVSVETTTAPCLARAYLEAFLDSVQGCLKGRKSPLR